MKKPSLIHWVDETDSTQNMLQRHISAYDNMSVLAARLQTAGRGQRGNKWLAAGGENLTFSMLLKFGAADGLLPPLRAVDQFGITRAATLAVTRYLEDEGIDSSIKWPNDIYLRNRKVCGMLIENVLEGGMVASSIVGIGLNVNQCNFPPELVNPTSMTLATGKAYDLEAEMEKVHSHLVRAFGEHLFLQGDPSGAEYIEKLYRRGTFHEFVRCSDGSAFDGKIVGVTEAGFLQVEKMKGELEEFAFKEISYII